MLKKEKALVSGNIAFALLAFAVPLVMGSLIQQLYITADAVIVGRFAGKSSLAAIDSVHTLFKFPLNFMNGLASGASIIISGYYGSRDEKNLQCSVRTALSAAFVTGIVCSAAGYILSPLLMKLISIPDDIFPEALTYTRITFSGLWAMVLYNMSAGILRSFGDSRRPTFVLMICSFINIAGDIFLVGVLKLGVSGAAFATLITQVISVAVTGYILGKEIKTTGFRKTFHINFGGEHMKQMIKTGFPLAVQSMLFPVANTIVQASINSMGTDIITAWGICDKLNMLIWLISDSMNPVMSIFTAQNTGAGKPDRVRSGAINGVMISVITVGAVSLILYLFCGTMSTWFLSPDDAWKLTPLIVLYIHMMAPFFVFYAIAEVFAGACSGMGNTFHTMIMTLITICLLRVFSVIFILPVFRTMECIVWIYISSWIVSGISFALMYYIKISRKKSIETKNE